VVGSTSINQPLFKAEFEHEKMRGSTKVVKDFINVTDKKRLCLNAPLSF
jgi:hypothetical protein